MTFPPVSRELENLVRQTTDLDDGRPYPVITGDYTSARPWARRAVVPGTPVAKPAPVFTKLDPSVVDDELARLEAEGSSGTTA